MYLGTNIVYRVVPLLTRSGYRLSLTEQGAGGSRAEVGVPSTCPILVVPIASLPCAENGASVLSAAPGTYTGVLQ